MPRFFCLLLPIVLLGAPVRVHAERWVLEFGPYTGHYDFDRLTGFVDRTLYGARATVHLNRFAKFDAEFDEVYTRRTVTDRRARQITLAGHARFEVERWAWSPSLFAGIAFVGLDDAEGPDFYGDAHDLGAGLRWKMTDRWNLRGEWMLRRQVFQGLRRQDDDTLPADEPGNRSLWGRSLRVGVGYVF